MVSQHIAMIIDGLPGGGAEKVVLTLSQGLLALGHRVTLISLRNVCHYRLPEGINYHVVADNCGAPWRKLTELRRRARQLESQVRCCEQQYGAFDLVISHLHKTDRIVRRCGALSAEKTWFCLHGVFSQSYLGNKQGFSRWRKRRKITGVYQRRNIIAVSDFVMKDLCQQFAVQPSRQRVIANPFDSCAIKHLAADAAPYPTDSYLLHVGRLHPTKRHDRLLEAYKLSGVQLPLVLLGEGSEAAQQHLKLLAEQLGIADRVHLAGFTTNPYPWIKQARMLILSSDSEGFGNVLVEALICGTQVVSTNCPGGPASILTGDLARGLSDLSAASLAQKIQGIYQQPAQWDPQGLERFELSTICQQYLSLSSQP